MRITNQNQTPVPSTDKGNNPDAAPTPRNEASSSASSLPSLPSRSYPDGLVPSFELFNLTATLQKIPPVRADVIEETIRRLAAAQLQTPSAIEQTARAILGL